MRKTLNQFERRGDTQMWKNGSPLEGGREWTEMARLEPIKREILGVLVGLTDDGEVDAPVEGAVPGSGHLALVLAAVPRRHVADHQQELRPAAAAVLYIIQHISAVHD